MKKMMLALGVTGLMLATYAWSATQQVRIYNWSELIGENTVKDFEKKTNISVMYDTFDNESTLAVKLLTGNSGYDVVVPTGSFIEQLIGAGALAELDRSKIPNWKNLDPELMKFVESKDPGNKFSFIYDWGTTGIGVNVGMVQERLPNQALDSYDLVFKSENASKLKNCGVALIDSPEDIYPVVLNYLKLDFVRPTAESLEQANKLLSEIKPSLRYINSGSYISDLANGDICAVVGWSGDVEIARRRAQEAGSKEEISYILPKEGTEAWFGFMSIPKDAPNKEAAYKFMNEILEPRVSADFTTTVGYSTAVPGAKEFLPKDVVTNRAIFPSEEDRKKMFWQSKLTPSEQRMMTRAWSKFKSGL